MSCGMRCNGSSCIGQPLDRVYCAFVCAAVFFDAALGAIDERRLTAARRPYEEDDSLAKLETFGTGFEDFEIPIGCFFGAKERVAASGKEIFARCQGFVYSLVRSSRNRRVFDNHVDVFSE